MIVSQAGIFHHLHSTAIRQFIVHSSVISHHLFFCQEVTAYPQRRTNCRCHSPMRKRNFSPHLAFFSGLRRSYGSPHVATSAYHLFLFYEKRFRQPEEVFLLLSYLSKDSVHFSISHTSIKNPQISCYQQQERFAHTLPQTGDSHMSSIVNRT